MCQSTAVVPFQFQTSTVRTIALDDGHWFIAKDVCSVLGISNSRDVLASLDDDEKGVAKADTLGGKQDMNIVNESGLYALIFKSRKPEARQFRKWVTGEVLPALRKTGRYAAPAGPANRRFIAAIDHEGRMTMTELAPGEIVVDPKRLARLLADPAFRLADGGDDHRAALLEIASVAMLRANYNANVAHDLLYGDERERRVAAQRMARVASA